MTIPHNLPNLVSRRGLLSLAGGAAVAASASTVLAGTAAHAKPPSAGRPRAAAAADVELDKIADTYDARLALVRGGYIPGPGTTGPLPGTSFTQHRAPAGVVTIRLTNADTTYDGVEFWGTVEPRATGITFRNCIFRGPDPLLVESLQGSARPGATAVIKAYDSPHFVLENCLIDPDAWVTSGHSPWRLANLTGLHGGNYTARWCDIRNTVDGIGIQAHNSTGIPATAKVTEIDRCWIHAGNFVNDYPEGNSDRTTHGDSIQFFSGKNITIHGCMIGGVRQGTGYVRWGRNAPAETGTMLGGSPLFSYNGQNDGDDHANAALMIKQEVANRPDLDPLIEQVLIEHNFISGGSSAVNVNTYNAAYGQDWSSLTLRHNRFFQRGVNWGRHTLYNTSSGVVETRNAGADAYLLRHPERCNAQIDEATNTVYDYVNNLVVAPIPIRQGD